MRFPSAGGGGSGDAGFVRADQIDLKSLDEQLERHLSRQERGGAAPSQPGSRRGESPRLGEPLPQPPPQQQQQQEQRRRRREDWEVDPAKLVIKGVIARGTFGTVHRGVYDGQDVAGIVSSLPHIYAYTTSQFQFQCP
jgi:hypothetical protein